MGSDGSDGTTITQSVHVGSDGFPTIIQSVDRRGGQRAPLLSPNESDEASSSPKLDMYVFCKAEPNHVYV